MHTPSTNPSRNFAIIGNVETTTEAEIKALVARAHAVQKSWKKLSIHERVSYLEKAYGAFEKEKEPLARIIAEEMGMPIRQARDEVGYGLLYFRWYLDNSTEYLAPKITRENEHEVHTVFYEPKGVIAAITPWNYPFMLFTWACIQPLLAGNTVIWKISKEVILTGKYIENIMKAALLPE
jgi:succinate-semialdehyde dehydrogenase/glutarate-semialdehyde dehydrogenase